MADNHFRALLVYSACSPIFFINNSDESVFYYNVSFFQGGNENNSFALSDPIEGILVVNKPLDYDYGSREFKLLIQASVSKTFLFS